MQNPILCATNNDINPNAVGVIYGDANELSQFSSEYKAQLCK